MSALTLTQAQTIVTAALAHARGQKFQPLAVLVLDARGVRRRSPPRTAPACAATRCARQGAWRAGDGIGSRTLGKRAEERPHFIAAVNDVVGGALVRCRAGVA